MAKKGAVLRSSNVRGREDSCFKTVPNTLMGLGGTDLLNLRGHIAKPRAEGGPRDRLIRNSRRGGRAFSTKKGEFLQAIFLFAAARTRP